MKLVKYGFESHSVAFNVLVCVRFREKEFFLEIFFKFFTIFTFFTLLTGELYTG